MEKQVLKAQEFQLTDENGKIRARLGLTKDQTPFLCFYDEQTIARVFFLLSESQQPHLIFYNSQHNPVLSLNIYNDKPAILLQGQKRELILQVTDQDEIGIHARDTQGNLLFRLFAEKEKTWFILSYPNNNKQIVLLAKENGNTTLGISAPEGESQIGLTVNKESPILMVFHKNGKASTLRIKADELEKIISKLEDTSTTK